MANHPANALLPPLTACSRHTEIFAGATFQLRASHPLYPFLAFVVCNHRERMVGVPSLANVRLADRSDEMILEGPVCLSFLQGCVAVEHLADTDGFLLSRQRPAVTYHDFDMSRQRGFERPTLPQRSEPELASLVTTRIIGSGSDVRQVFSRDSLESSLCSAGGV